MRLFFTKFLAVTAALITVLVADGVMLGTISVWGGLALLPALAMLTWRLFQLSLRRPTRRRRGRVSSRQAAAPALRVVMGGHGPGGPKAA